MIGNNNNRQEDLERLSRFIAQEKIYGWTSNFWFYCLRKKYPFEFMQLARAYKLCNRVKRLGIEHFINDAIKDLNNLQKRFNYFLVHYPSGEAETEEFNKLIQKLESRVIKQSEEN